ncbi:MAG: malto-oligosyltrehalose synthase [Elainella sp.]
MRIPTATYRIQFTADFGFDSARKIAPYLADLGISDLYASPIFKARAGSTHGYDVVDPTQLNPELGSPESFEALVQQLQQQQMGWLQDIVPNHMAYESSNQWLMDVLENGLSSTYVDYFDIAWTWPFEGNHEPILVPLLGNFYGECLENGELQLQYDQGILTINYHSLRIPLNIESYATLLTHNLGSLAKTLGRNHPVFVRLLGILYSLKGISSDITGQQRRDQVEFVRSLLWELYRDQDEVRAFLDANLQTFNGEVGQPESFDLLDALLTNQHFRLAFWKVGAEEMNYRRFFTVNELISVKVEEVKIFNATHALIFKLVDEGKFTGLRIDHIDGLYDPTEYLERLRAKVGDLYITVEKILQPGEDLPQLWPIQGTSGYDYLNYVNSVFCQNQNQSALDQIYRDFTGQTQPIEDLVIEKKQLILEKNLAGDVDNLALLLKKISSRYRYGNDFTVNSLKRAISEVLTRFPIYRTYTAAEVLDSDRPYIEQVIAAAQEQSPLLKNELQFIEKLLLLDYDATLTQAEKDQWLYWVMRLQQYTGPLMAKGVEDTVLYVYNRLLSLNEVGGDPARFGIDLAEFHRFNQHRQQHWPLAMSATSTHDTKRGEDVRARLNVLSEIPQEWQQQVQLWRELNQAHKVQSKHQTFPAPNDEYLLYQTIVGALPFAESEWQGFRERLKDFMLKAIREAKVYTNWLRNNTAYESACLNFVEAILSEGENNSFLSAIRPFQQQVARYGVINSLAQTLLKLTTPGVPDFYQGSELWDFSLVDPDNRRPVDFSIRQVYLEEIKTRVLGDIFALTPDLLAAPEDGRIKLFLVYQTLKARAAYPAVFQSGDYQPLSVTGRYADHVIAFARTAGETSVITVVPRFCTALVKPGEYPLGDCWQDTAIQLPAESSSSWKNLLTAQPISVGHSLPLSEVLQHFPVALLVS